MIRSTGVVVGMKRVAGYALLTVLVCVCGDEQAKEAVGASTLTLEERMCKVLNKHFHHGGRQVGQPI
jgi:hypothetical protein